MHHLGGVFWALDRFYGMLEPSYEQPAMTFAYITA